MAIALIANKTNILEGATARVKGQFVNEDSVDIGLSDLITVDLTLYDLCTDTVINGRNAQNVLNANNVTVGSTGAFEWFMQPLDNVFVGAEHVIERHIIIIKWSWTASAILRDNLFVAYVDLERVEQPA